MTTSRRALTLAAALLSACAAHPQVDVDTPPREQASATPGGALLRLVQGEARGCDHGGDLIEVGRDGDGNRDLSDDEVELRVEQCYEHVHGHRSVANGAVLASDEEPAGTHCPGGGVRFDIGEDLDNDGLLDPKERDPTQAAFSCFSTRQALGFVQISSGFDSTCAVTSAGRAMCWGSNAYDQLGTSAGASRVAHTAPADVVGLTTGVSSISSSIFHACAVTDAGGVKCWGNNLDGQLGDGTTSRRRAPVDVVGLASRATSVGVGTDYTCALLDTGRVQCWGSNTHQQLGDGTNTRRRLVPADVVGLGSGITSISLRRQHACAVSRRGDALCWGSNSEGQLGNGTRDTTSTPTHVVGLDAAVESISTGHDHTCAITSTREVMCWGNNHTRQLDRDQWGVFPTPSRVESLGIDATSVSAGEGHTCASDAAGRTFCWGQNIAGELGDGTYDDAIGSVGVSVGTMKEAKDADFANASRPVEVRGHRFATISAGSLHGCGITHAGEAMCWGSNSTGQLGVGSKNDAFGAPRRVLMPSLDTPDTSDPID